MTSREERKYQRAVGSVIRKTTEMERLLEEAAREASEFCHSNQRGGMSGYANLAVLIPMYRETAIRTMDEARRSKHY